MANIARPLPNMVRYLVRRSTRDVFIWTEMLSRRNDLEEVYALNAEAALDKQTMPDPRNISIAELDALSKDELIVFAETKLGVKLDGSMKKRDLLDEVKAKVFSLPPLPDEIEEVTVGPAKDKTSAMATAQQARKRAGA